MSVMSPATAMGMRLAGSVGVSPRRLAAPETTRAEATPRFDMGTWPTGLHPVQFGAQLTPAPVLPRRRTQIIATLGPASNSREGIRALLLAGVNVFRLNFSHGKQEQHGSAIDLIREESTALNRPALILADMQGPKIRVGLLPNGSMELVPGQTVRIIRQESLDPENSPANTIPTSYPALIDDIDPTNPANRILLDDGKLELRPLSKDADSVTCEVVRGGILTNKKGINLPGVQVSAPSLSAKDRSDIAFALHKGVDALAISFVRTAEDIRQARRYVQSLAAPGVNTDVPLIAKMEKPEAVQSPALEEIIKEADGVMVARGDLGVEVDITRLPRIQKKIIAVANSVSKPVIVATQMLESMLASPQPSRSDVTDIANAVEDGADLLMLSGETSVGQYPAEAVAMMGSIIERTEQAVEPTSLPVLNNQLTIWETYARFFKTLLSEGQAQGIAAYVDDSTVRRSLPAPVQPGWKVLAFTPNERLFRQLSLLRGVQPVKIPALPEGEDGVVAQQAYLKQLLAGTRPTGRSDARPWILLGEAPGERTPWFVLQPALATA